MVPFYFPNQTPVGFVQEQIMTYEAQLLINDIERMQDSLLKLIYATDNNPDIKHNNAMMMEGIAKIKSGTSLVVNSITNK